MDRYSFVLPQAARKTPRIIRHRVREKSRVMFIIEMAAQIRRR
jgi:hypothetical protein